SNSLVCVMMTAMDVRSMPAALLRSGRVEVWLEMKAPDFNVRCEILHRYTNEVASKYTEFDAEIVANESEGFTPADLRRIVGDAKALLGYDLHKQGTARPFTEYLVESVHSLRSLRNAIARATG